jgi:hypothetical protein
VKSMSTVISIRISGTWKEKKDYPIMKTIWKYELDAAQLSPVDMPQGSIVLRVGVQNGKIFIWAMHDADMEREDIYPRDKRHFTTVGTGWQFDAGIDPLYYSSVSIPDTAIGELVFHIFEVFN